MTPGKIDGAPVTVAEGTSLNANINIEIIKCKMVAVSLPIKVDLPLWASLSGAYVEDNHLR